MASILVALLLIGGLILWLSIGLFLARTFGRLAAAGGYQEQMDAMHREARRDLAPIVTRGGPAGPAGQPLVGPVP
jgi:hypothetical protein